MRVGAVQALDGFNEFALLDHRDKGLNGLAAGHGVIILGAGAKVTLAAHPQFNAGLNCPEWSAPLR